MSSLGRVACRRNVSRPLSRQVAVSLVVNSGDVDDIAALPPTTANAVAVRLLAASMIISENLGHKLASALIAAASPDARAIYESAWLTVIEEGQS